MIQAPYPEIPVSVHYPAQHHSAEPPRGPQQGAVAGRAPQAPGTILRPEPRQLPNREEMAETQPRYRPEPTGDVSKRLDPHGPRPKGFQKSYFLRVAVPLLFVCMVLGVIFLVKTVLQGGFGTDETPPSEKVRTILPEEQVETFEDLTGDGNLSSLPVSEPPMPDIGAGDGSAELSQKEAPVDDGEAALKLLERFLEMDSLEGRLPVIETRLPEEELRDSVLAGKLPDARITVDIRETNSREQVVDFFYHVDFLEESGVVNPQTMLVRKRGISPPKVVVDPFLDLFGGRFERYAEAPKKDAGMFQVIISASSSCYEDIPGADKKFTLRVLSRENAKEIARAYCGKQSKIGRMLEDETSGISYGQAKACTVFMRWNSEDDPLRPFLEALDITSLDWNP